MSTHDFDLHFIYKQKEYDFSLKETESSSTSVVINGRKYSIQGTDLALLKKLVPELSISEGIEAKFLLERLGSLKAYNIQMVDKLSAIAQSHLSKKEKGNVIILIGHSTAGKSTIIDEIAHLSPQRLEFGGDRTPAERIYKYLAKHYGEHGVSDEDWKFFHLSLIPERGDWQIHKALFGDYKFKKTLSEGDKRKVEKIGSALREALEKFFKTHPENPISYTVHKAFEAAQKGNDVVFDVVLPEDIPPDPSSNGLIIKKVLTYCPFQVLSERLFERNRKAIELGREQETRFGIFPFEQFAKLFRVREKQDSDSKVANTVTRQEVEETFEKHFDLWIQSLEKNDPKEFAKTNISELKSKDKQKLLSALGFSSSDPMEKGIELVPASSCDLAINTADPTLGDTPEKIGKAAANKILSLLK